MSDGQVRHIAPFINERFMVTSKWWNERVNPITRTNRNSQGT